MFTRRQFRFLLLPFFALISLAGVTRPAGAVTIVGVSNFGNYNNATNPNGPLVQGPDGSLYGTTAYAGTNGQGTVYRLDPDGTLTTLYTFPSAANDAIVPKAGLIWGKDGDLYGTTQYGGANNTGTIFKITPGGALTILHSFSALNSGLNANGAYPLTALTLGTDGNFYGTASLGGAGGDGMIFKLSPGGAFTTLYAFSALSAGKNSDGAVPLGTLVQGSDGSFYGTAELGGAYGDGTLYKVSVNGAFTLLHTFSATDSQGLNADGAEPAGGLVLGNDGNFYGTAMVGGPHGAGVVFRITANGAFTFLHGFDGIEGLRPTTLTRARDGDFYGGVYQDDPMTGIFATLYKITPDGRFILLATPGGRDGPLNSIMQASDGTFYYTDEYLLMRMSLAPLDFNGDGYSDLLWQNQTTGEIVQTLMNGTVPVSWTDISSIYYPNWKIVGTPDIEDSGWPNLLWQDKATGDVDYAIINVMPAFQGIDPNFQIVSTPDLNGDGFQDLLWQNQVTGEVVYTLIAFPMQAIAWGDLFKHIDPVWKIVGTPDLNGDSYPDILFQNSVTGDVVYALMNGLTAVQWGYLFKGVDPNFQIVGTPELNRDGHPDLLWQNKVTGEVVYTLMNGTTALAWGDLFKTFNTQWKLVGLH